MKLKCGTILNIYAHKNKTILCQIKVRPLNDKKPRQSWDVKNTCRFLTPHQWNAFDRELEQLIDLQIEKNNDEWDEEKFRKFYVKPNIEVNVHKSKLSTTNFYNCFGSDKVGDDDGEVDISGNGVAGSSDIKVKQIVYVLECLLNYKEHRPILSIEESQEYEPELETSPEGKLYSPSSYEPYTPSKKKYRINSLDTIQTPGLDFLGYESNDDTYSPMPLMLSSISGTTISETSASTIIPEYKPAPIKEKRPSKDSVKSNYRETKNDVVYETDDEQQTSKNHRALRNRLSKKKVIKYIPKSQEIIEAPAYVPTPIEEVKHNDKEIKADSKEDAKPDKENINDKNLKTIDENPSGSLVNTKKTQTSKLKEKSSKKLDYKEKYTTKYEERNEKIAKNVLLKPTTSSSSDDEDFLSRVPKTKSHIENDKEKFEVVTKKQNKKSQKSYIHITIASETENVKDSSPPKNRTREIHKNVRDHDTAKLRRSERSPNKPRRLIEESKKLEITNQSKNRKLSPRHKELFGSDYYDDDDFEKNIAGDNNNNAAAINTTNKASMLHTPRNEKPQKLCSSSSSSSAKKKRKRNKSSDCEQEKRTISTWLSKKKSNSDLGPASTPKEKPKSLKSSSSKTTKKIKSAKGSKTRRSKSASPQPRPAVEFLVPSKEELEEMKLKTKLQHENNEKLKAELQKIIAPPPKKVANLCLKDMSISNLLATFDDHKHILDDIYQRNRKKDHIKSHDGINHCFVIRLMEPQTQMKMLEKLTDVYSSSTSTTQATLYANAMLPEWIIRIYMEKYNFTREEAMQQIKAQDDYQIHIDEQNESAFMFD